MAQPDWPPKEEFADRLARLRRHKKLDNGEIARATGVKPKTVSMWVNGQEPKGSALLALARLFDVTPDYLLNGESAVARREKARLTDREESEVTRPRKGVDAG